MRVSRTLTRANSAATKKALAATKSTTRNTCSSAKVSINPHDSSIFNTIGRVTKTMTRRLRRRSTYWRLTGLSDLWNRRPADTVTNFEYSTTGRRLEAFYGNGNGQKEEQKACYHNRRSGGGNIDRRRCGLREVHWNQDRRIEDGQGRTR